MPEVNGGNLRLIVWLGRWIMYWCMHWGNKVYCGFAVARSVPAKRGGRNNAQSALSCWKNTKYASYSKYSPERSDLLPCLDPCVIHLRLTFLSLRVNPRCRAQKMGALPQPLASPQLHPGLLPLIRNTGGSFLLTCQLQLQAVFLGPPP